MIKDELLKTYKYKIELHAHSSPVSPCCNCSMERTLELYSERKVNAICLTNHFYKSNPLFSDKSKSECIDLYLCDYERMQKLAEPYGIKILLGCELRFTENINDYLIYGVNREILEEAFDYFDSGLYNYRKNVKLNDSVFVQAHPFRDNIAVADSSLVDGYETLNFHKNHNSRNAVCSFFAKDNGVGICTGGSDFHHDIPYHSAACIMLCKELPADSFELAKLIKSGDYVFLLGDNHVIIP